MIGEFAYRVNAASGDPRSMMVWLDGEIQEFGGNVKKLGLGAGVLSSPLAPSQFSRSPTAR
jgi:hypothetical protein